MKKLTGILIGILVLSLSVGVYATGFKDIPNTHWAYESVQWAVSEGLIEGYDDGTYRPKNEITEQEFASILARYTYKGNTDDLKAPVGTYWADGYYNFLKQYELPLRGYNNQKAKATALTRGEIARIIAAKNGFNLTERQAIYYMYENDISYGMIDGQLTFESYGVEKAVSRAQIPAFFQRLSEKGHTTFMGKPSNVSGKEIGGIAGVPQDKTEITDKMFDDLAKDKGITNPSKSKVGTLQNPLKIAKNSDGEFKLPYDPETVVRQDLIVEMNGIITPCDPTVTMSDPSYGITLRTVLNRESSPVGFNNKDLFVETVQKHWGKVLDKDQIDRIVSTTHKHWDAYEHVPSEDFAMYGTKNAVIIQAGGGGVTIQICTENWAKTAGYTKARADKTYVWGE